MVAYGHAAEHGTPINGEDELLRMDTIYHMLTDLRPNTQRRIQDWVSARLARDHDAYNEVQRHQVKVGDDLAILDDQALKDMFEPESDHH